MTLRFQQFSDLGKLGPRGGLFRVEGADGLVVLLHAYKSTPAALRNVAFAARELLPRSDIFVPRLPVSVFSLSDPEQIAADLIEVIDDLYDKSGGRDGGGYSDIVFVGHSLGAMMARKVWALAHGVTPFAAIDETVAARHPWRGRVSRIVLFAALNRGGEFPPHLVH